MADTQSASAESKTTCVEDQACSRMSLIANLKANREVLSNLPEIIEQWHEKETTTTDQPKTNEQRRDEPDRLANREQSEEEKQLIFLKEEINRKAKRVTELEQTIEEMTPEIDAMKSEHNLMCARERISKPRKELKAKEKEVDENMKQQEEKIEGLRNEHQKKVDELSDELKKMREQLSEKNDRIQAISEEFSRIHTNHKSRHDSLLRELEEKEEKITHYTQRLASLSEKRVKQDQRLVEDTTSANRQSELEKAFLHFFDNERIDACDNMQSFYHKEEDSFVYIFYPRLACIIFETAYEIVKVTKEAACELVMELLKKVFDQSPMMGAQYLDQRKLSMERQSSSNCSVEIVVDLWGDRSSDPKDIVDGILLNLKETADTCSLDFLKERVKSEAFKKWTEWYEKDKSCNFKPAKELIPLLDKYIKDCLRLTWKMVTQVPPLKLEFHCSKFDKLIHMNRGYHSSYQGSGKPHRSAGEEQEEEIECYLWPGLQDGGGRKIHEAQVICKIKE